MHDFGWHAVDGFQYHKIAATILLISPLILRQIKIHDVEHRRPHLSFKWLLAKFTLQGFPKIGSNLRARVYCSFCIQPLFKTKLVYITHRTCTFTWLYQRIFWFLFTKTDPTDFKLTVCNALVHMDSFLVSLSI